MSFSKTKGYDCFQVVVGDKKIIYKVDPKERDGIKLVDIRGKYEVLPYGADERGTFLVSGQSGSGKSQWSRDYCITYLKKFKKNHAYLISAKNNNDEDEDYVDHGDVFNKITSKRFHRILINEENFLDPETKLKLSDFHNSLVIYDDIESFEDKEMMEAVYKLSNSQLMRGRSSHQSTIFISHLLLNGNYSKVHLAESQFLVFFPGGDVFQLEKALRTRIGLSKDTVQKLIRYPSRWVCLRRNRPSYVITEDSAFLL